MDDDAQNPNTYAHSLTTLSEALKDVERPGDFFAAGSFETAPPLLEITGAGVLSFPVPDAQARAVIEAAAERAPYGRGDETIVDESVRKVWQIDPVKIVLGGKRWERTLSGIVAQVTAALGRAAGSLEAQFYKMLIYGEGGFFLAHRDTEKAPGMLGTLIIVLPSAHEGGELIIRHNDRETVQDLRNVDPGVIRFAAFYADCEHEVRQVTRGFRVCLVYNLIMAEAADGQAPAVPDARPQVEAAARALTEWIHSPRDTNKVVYLLEHRYTEAALSFAHLKGRDAALADVLIKAASRSDCALHLAMVHIEESGWAEYHGGYYRRRRWNDEEQDTDDFEIGEVCDVRRYIAQWRNTRDEREEFGEIPLEDGEVLPVGALDGEAADDTHFSEATGNEGASFERTYLRAALVIWPQAAFDEICASAGFEATLARLEQRVADATAPAGSTEAAASVRRLVALLPENWPSFGIPVDACERAIRALVRFGDLELLARHMAPVIQKRLPRDKEVLLDWARLAGPTGFLPIAEGLFARASRLSAIDGLRLWTRLAETWSGHDERSVALEQLLTRLLEKLSRTAYKSAARVPGDEEEEEEFADSYQTYQPTPSVPIPCPPDELARFLHTVEKNLGGARLEDTLAQIYRNDATFSVTDSLVPALRQMDERSIGISVPLRDAIWCHCAELLLQRADSPPRVPTDWTLPLTEAQRTTLRADLRDFALHPRQKVLRLRLRTDLRQEVHATIERLRLDMTHVTERRGSPYTLVCTKTLGHYKRACDQYRKDYAALQALLQLQPAEAKDLALVARLKSAAENGKHWTPTDAADLEPPSS